MDIRLKSFAFQMENLTRPPWKGHLLHPEETLETMETMAETIGITIWTVTIIMGGNSQ